MVESPFPEIERTEISIDELKTFTHEGQFMKLTVELTKEVGSYIVIASQILGSNGLWSREQAAIGGNFVRLYKLFSALLDQTCQHRRETTFILSRLAFETIVTTRFLIQEFSEELIKSYIQHSLAHEQRLYQTIQKNITARSGLIIPIEDRMIKSIERSFKVSGIDINQMPNKKERSWGGKNLLEKAKTIGIDEAYLAMFGGPSHDIHGSWMDLCANHLNTEEEGYFSSNMDWGTPRPQILLTICLISLDAIADFIHFMGGDEALNFISNKLNDIQNRLLLLNGAHEAYLSTKTWPEI
jgi:hypothetical protein